VSQHHDPPTTGAARTLVLWDIDLTLLDMRRMGATWFREALVEVTGRELPRVEPGRRLRFGGRTDRWIAREMLTAVGCEPTDELIARLHTAAEHAARRQHATMAELGVVLPGVPEVLSGLAALPSVAQTLVTGNLRAIADLKMGAFGLDRHVDLDIGGYGATSELREHLVAEAVAGARDKHGTPFTDESVVVVGDTPHDVRGALAHGALAVGVATGNHTPDELLAAGAHVVLPDLSDTTLVMATVLRAADQG
jgi:phosphoglycolate phosphatase-like HAD superfamily hydrolase